MTFGGLGRYAGARAMRYLFGDSKAFVYQFDFLATLELFMSAATRVVQLEGDAHKKARDLEAASEARVAGIEALTALHQSICLAMEASIGVSQTGPRGTMSAVDPHPDLVEYVDRMKDHSARLIRERRQQHKDEGERATLALKAESEQRAALVRQYFDEFFRHAELPIESSRVSLKLGEGKDAKNELGVVFRNPGNVISSFVLSAARHPEWAHPRKVSEFVAELSLPVGTKKSFFKGQVSPEQVLLTDYVISRADVHDRGFELALRKRADVKESFVFKVTKNEKGTAGEVDRVDDPNKAALSPALAPEDIAKLDALASALRGSFTALFRDRESVVRIELEGKRVYENQLALELVKRFVAVFAPVVEEVVSRSPSPEELSLKREDDTGRREEIYLRRDELLMKLQPLNAEGRGYFAPLGLDDWVPTLTVRPPDIG